NVLVWVKLHGFPVTTFSEDGLSSIATKLGTLLMLDSYTSDMYIQSWGRSSYAKTLIEVQADVELKHNIVVAIPKLVGDGFYTCNVHVEYEWKPPSSNRVSPWKGVVRFGKKGKLAPRYVGPFEIIERVGPVAYRLKLPQELSCVHDTFHVSNLKKCLAEPDVQVPLDEIEVDENLCFVEEPLEIVE
ncbi:hypothetical protein Tco_0526978, partial [Tanacetum coccineum]